MITFLMNAENIFFSCVIQKVIMFGSRSSSCIPGDKEAQNGSSGALHAFSHSMPQRLQNVTHKKKTKRHAGYCTSEYIYLIKQLTS